MTFHSDYLGYDTDIPLELQDPEVLTGAKFWREHPPALKCPECGSATVLKPAGVSKTGNRYDAFYGCVRYPACRGGAK